MALTTVTTTIDLHDLLGVAFDVRRTKVTLTTNAPKDTIHDTSTGKSRVGGGSVTLSADGVATATTWAPGASANPLTWQTTFHVDYVDSATRQREQQSYGPYTITTSGNLTALEQEQVAIPTTTAAQSATAAGASATAAAGSATSAASSATAAATSATSAQTARTGAETARAGAEAAEDAAQALVISDLGTTDGQTRALIEAPASQTAQALSAAFVRPAVMLVGAGIDPTGVADSTSALQAKITAAPQGADIHFPAGVFKFSALTVDKGKRLIGTGYQFYRDACTTFGDATYQDNQWFKGTLLRSTATTGAAITLLDTFVTGGAAKDFILVGPGSGTSIGIALGSTTSSVIDPDFDVMVCNFSLGLRTRNVNEGQVHIRTRGCVKGMTAENGSNNVAFYCNFQKGTDGASTSADTLGSTFYSPICQSLTGTGLSIDGTAVTIVNPYHESNGGIRSIDFVGGSRNVLINPSLNTTPDTVRVQAAASKIRIIGMDEARLHDGSTSTIVDTPRLWIPITGAAGVAGKFAGTVDTAGVFTASAAHGLVVGQTVTFSSVVAGFARLTVYYVVSVPTTTTFALSATSGGTAITTGITAGSFFGFRGVGWKGGATVTGTVDTAGLFTSGAAHGFAVGQTVTFSSVPAGFAAGTVYFVVSVPTTTTFTASATSGGAAITTGITAGAFTGTKNLWTNAATKKSKFRLSTDGQHVEFSVWATAGLTGSIAFTMPAELAPQSPREKGGGVNRTTFVADIYTRIAQSGDVSIFGGLPGESRVLDFDYPIDKSEA